MRALSGPLLLSDDDDEAEKCACARPGMRAFLACRARPDLRAYSLRGAYLRAC
jgi:hypothetical protein